MKVKDVLSDESKWIKGDFAVDENNEPVPRTSDKACKFCLLGSIMNCYLDIEEQLEVTHAVLDEIQNKTGGPMSIPHFNDHPRTTFKDIQDIINKLDI